MEVANHMPYTTKVVRRIGWSAATVLALLPLVFSGAAANAAAPGPAPVLLGTADAFAVLAGTTITNTGSSVITGNLGLHPGSAVVGFPPGTVSGATHAGDAAAQQAATDLTTAYNDAAGRSFTANVAGRPRRPDPHARRLPDRGRRLARAHRAT